MTPNGVDFSFFLAVLSAEVGLPAGVCGQRQGQH